MAYTNSWSNVIPAGSAAANTIHLAIQQLRLDIQERMDSIVDDWTDDPVVLTTSGIGVQTGVKLTFSPFLIQSDQDERDVNCTAEYWESDNQSSQDYFMPIRLPYGCTLTDFDVLVDTHDASNVVCQLRYQQWNGSPASQQVASVSATGSGIEIVAILNAASHSVGSDAYYVQFSEGAGNRFRVYAAQATINVAGLDEYI